MHFYTLILFLSLFFFNESFSLIQGDIRNYEDICSLIEGADVVYHMASYGMSGREQVGHGVSYVSS